jgi:mannosyltransferase
VVLLAVSQVHPLFTARYVESSLPALALLCATGLSWLADAATRVTRSGLPLQLAWLPAAVIVVLLGALLAGPQQALRRPGSRIDNLRRAAAVLATHELPGDAVLYLPSSRRIVTMSYPVPFRRLRDIALGRSPAASATLAGTDVSPALLRHRFTDVRRVWVVTIRGLKHPPPDSHTDQMKIALIGRLRLAGRWQAGAVVLRLYTTYPDGGAESLGAAWNTP